MDASGISKPAKIAAACSPAAASTSGAGGGGGGTAAWPPAAFCCSCIFANSSKKLPSLAKGSLGSAIAQALEQVEREEPMGVQGLVTSWTR